MGILQARNGEGIWENEYISHSADSSAPETITTLLIGFTPIQNKKFFKKKVNVNRDKEVRDLTGEKSGLWLGPKSPPHLSCEIFAYLK